MISCKNISKLLASDQLARQRWWTRMEVRMHLAMCDFCSRFARQLAQLRSGVRQVHEEDDADADLEARVIKRLSGR